MVQEDCGLTLVPDDKGWLPEVFALEPEAPEIVNRMAPWLLRIELDRALMVDKRLSIGMVAQRISEEYEDFLHVVATDDNAPELVLRLRILRSAEGKEEGGWRGWQGAGHGLRGMLLAFATWSCTSS